MENNSFRNVIPKEIKTASPSSMSMFPEKNNQSKDDLVHSYISKSSSHRNKRAHLTFADYDIVYQIPHLSDMSEQEIQDCWISAQDLQDIRNGCIGTVRDMNTGEPPEGIFLRGLDQHSNKYRERRDEISNQIYDAVYRIQEFQRLSGKDSSEVLAKLCAKHSEPSVIAAHTAAISDIFSAFKETWSHRTIPDAKVFEEHPEGQGTYH